MIETAALIRPTFPVRDFASSADRMLTPAAKPSPNPKGNHYSDACYDGTKLLPSPIHNLSAKRVVLDVTGRAETYMVGRFHNLFTTEFAGGDCS
jgi:hypothetical protein